MKKINVEIEVPDKFEAGQCYECPLSYTEWYEEDGYSDCGDICVLHSKYDECPLTEVLKNE